jgi:hypothetical protein
MAIVIFMEVFSRGGRPRRGAGKISVEDIFQRQALKARYEGYACERQ